MKRTRENNTHTYTSLFVIIAGSIAGLYLLGFLDPLPDPLPDADQGRSYVYYGAQAETLRHPGVSDSDFEHAQDLLSETDYFGAYAIGAQHDGERQSGLAQGAHTIEIARAYAHAACGQGCKVIADRLPMHRDPTDARPVATRAMVENLMLKRPFSNDFLALGGKGAWGHRAKGGGKSSAKSAMRRAAEDCETRRSAEVFSQTDLSAPCRITRFGGIEDLRPAPVLYPADYTIALTDLVPVSRTQVLRHGRNRTRVMSTLLRDPLPRFLHGARATNGDGAFETVRAAGWPEAGRAIALYTCNAERRPNDAPCKIVRQRVPAEPVPSTALAVTPEMHQSYVEWRKTSGPGAFAIGPFGGWGFSFEHDDATEAVQKAADWCWYHTRQTWAFRQINNAFLDPGLRCRVVAIRKK